MSENNVVFSFHFVLPEIFQCLTLMSVLVFFINKDSCVYYNKAQGFSYCVIACVSFIAIYTVVQKEKQIKMGTGYVKTSRGGIAKKSAVYCIPLPRLCKQMVVVGKEIFHCKNVSLVQ